MFRNYLRSALRNLYRHKGFALINILGLAIGLTGCLLIGLFVLDERGYDRSIRDGDRIYRLYNESQTQGVRTFAPVVPPAYTTFMQQNYPEVESFTRMLMTLDRMLMERGSQSGYEDGGKFVDSTFISFFSLPMKAGDARALQSPEAVVLTEELAKRYFGNEDPMGKPVFIDKDTFEVRGVLAPLPDRFHLQFRYLLPMQASGIPQERMESWGWHQIYSYIKLRPGASYEAVQGKFRDHLRREVPAEVEESVSISHLQPMTQIHLHSADFIFDNAVRGNATYVNALTLIAVFVLVIACFNFINLATARSVRRAKEIGVRKVVGAGRGQIILQFLGETVLLSLFALVLAIVVTLICLPYLNDFTGKSMTFSPFTHGPTAALLLLSGVVVGILAGFYPALVLSGFRPIAVLKDRVPLRGGGGGAWLRTALVVVQFSISALLMIATIVVYRQTQYLSNKDLGFSKDQLVYFQVREEAASNVEAFKNALRAIPGVRSVTSGYGLPGDAFAGDAMLVPTAEGEKTFRSNLFLGDHDYVKTLGLQLVAGRDFSRDYATDASSAFIINQQAVKAFGFESPEKAIGRDIGWPEWVPVDTLQPVKRGKVIGVVKDFHYKSLHEEVIPSVIQVYDRELYKVAVKLDGAQVRGAVEGIQGVWQKFAPGFPLDIDFMDETYGKMYSSEEKLSRLLWIFSALAIFIGCMGLFGLAASSAEQRRKEIGIRKVLGAGTFDIMTLLSRRFLILVSVASLIAFPLAWWGMSRWLEAFPYRVGLSWWVFALAVGAGLVTALVTVAFQALRAAHTNPINSLRSE